MADWVQRHLRLILIFVGAFVLTFAVDGWVRNLALFIGIYLVASGIQIRNED